MRGKGVGWGGRLFEAGRLLTFSAFRMGAYSRWALIRGWALIRINTVPEFLASKIESIQKQAMHIIFATCSCDEALSGLSHYIR